MLAASENCLLSMLSMLLMLSMLFAVNAANAKLGVKLAGYLNQYLCVIATLELATKDTSRNTPGMKDLSKKTKKLGRFAHKSTLATKELKSLVKRF